MRCPDNFIRELSAFTKEGGCAIRFICNPAHPNYAEVLGLSLQKGALTDFRNAFANEARDTWTQHPGYAGTTCDMSRLGPSDTAHDLCIYERTLQDLDFQDPLIKIGKIMVKWQRAAKAFNSEQIAKTFSDAFGVTIIVASNKPSEWGLEFRMNETRPPSFEDRRKIDAVFAAQEIGIKTNGTSRGKDMRFYFPIERYQEVLSAVAKAPAGSLNLAHLLPQKNAG